MEDKISSAAIVALIVFGLSKLFEIGVFWWKYRSEREKFIRALYAEIDFNTRDMEEFLSNSAGIPQVTEKLRSDSKFLPHITDSRHKEIYKSQIGLIHHTGDDYIGDVVTFYGIMDRISSEVAGVYLPSYPIISGEGRASVINDLFNHALECSTLGGDILSQMEGAYPSYRLRRKTRKAPDNMSGADLADRVKKFTLDLDRARTTHKGNSGFY